MWYTGCMLDLSGRSLVRQHVMLYAYQIDTLHRIASHAGISFAEALRDLVDRGLMDADNPADAVERRAQVDALAARLIGRRPHEV